jgi:hypothetical protein
MDRRHWGFHTLLGGATTDDLYNILAETLTVLDARKQLPAGLDRIECEHAEIRREPDRWYAVYYATAEIALEDRGQGVTE